MIVMAAGALLHLSNWDNFYVIVGSSAGALIGLQFVVITLIAGTGKVDSKQVSAFGTPTVIHFSAALLISAILSAPWETLAGLRAILGIFGVIGIAYSVRAILHAVQQKTYEPELEDWLWFFALPLLGYVILFVAAALLVSQTLRALFMIAGVSLTLLFVGIHNSWDTVTFVVTTDLAAHLGDRDGAKRNAPPTQDS